MMNCKSVQNPAWFRSLNTVQRMGRPKDGHGNSDDFLLAIFNRNSYFV